MKKGTTLFLKAAIFLIGIIILALCIFWLPSAANEAAALNPEFAYLHNPVLYGLYITALPFFIALYYAYKLLYMIDQRNAFTKLAVHTLKSIKHCAITISILYIIGGIFLIIQNALHPGIAIIGLAITFISVVIAAFAAVVQRLLKNALEIKLENDLTI